ncbi:Do family serine endopeptidase [Planctomicrobium sp. SH527]|uniref:Do family serine endopeptidase n=1 Tax=Planctomicrobium sp. SH527 TaxID=3448123 RepID=UPI003F5C4138
MKARNNVGLMMTAIGGICLGAAAVGVSQPVTTGNVLAPAPARAPEDLSIAFRDVSQRVLPAVVSITAEARPAAVTKALDGRGSGSPEEQMLRRFFGDDPRFEQFMQQSPEGGRPRPKMQGTGSGFIVDADGVILTNSHVVENADRVKVRLHDGRELQAESWNVDPRSDIAIVRVKSTDKLPALVLGDSNKMQVGDWVLALGNPFNVGTTVTSGIISATGRGPGINEREEYLQTDAAINPGNSGGPLVNLYGEVIGINTAISSRSGGYDGIGFAIPSENVRWVAEQLIAHGEVKRSYLGVKLQELTNDLRSQFEVPIGKGALVGDILPNTPASKAKFEAGDVIVEFDGRTITDRDSLIGNVERSAPNKSYNAKVIRGGKEVTVAVQLEAMPSDYTAALRRVNNNGAATSPAKPANEDVAKLGVQVLELNSELTTQLGLKDGAAGVVVKSVTAGGPADEAGLKAGDLIERAGTKTIQSMNDFRDAVTSADLDRGLLLHIKRGEESAFVVVKKDTN